VTAHLGPAADFLLTAHPAVASPRRPPRRCRFVGRHRSGQRSKISKRRRQAPLTRTAPVGDCREEGDAGSEITMPVVAHRVLHAARPRTAPQRRPQAELAASAASRLDGVRRFLTALTAGNSQATGCPMSCTWSVRSNARTCPAVGAEPDHAAMWVRLSAAIADGGTTTGTGLASMWHECLAAVAARLALRPDDRHAAGET
jgi:hypothetical protein